MATHVSMREDVRDVTRTNPGRVVRREQRRVRRAEFGRRRRARRSVVWRWRRALYLLTLAAVAGFFGVLYVLVGIELPELEDQVQLDETSYLCAADVADDCGPENALVQLSAEQDRVIVPYESLPQVLIDAVIVSEDRKFFTHLGVDPAGITRAAIRDVTSDGVVQGGSTITQQYVKNTFLTNEKTIVRKVREAVLAIKLEQLISKEEILERYLNTIYFGRGAYGVQAASRAYFEKDVEELGLPESAFLAGLIRAPNTAEPSRDPVEAERRRRVTLVGMVDEGYITQAEADVANDIPMSEPFVLDQRPRSAQGEVSNLDLSPQYFIDFARQQLPEEYRGALFTEGLRIYTTLDLDYQRAAIETVTETLTDPDDPAASIVAIDSMGNIVAMVGGTDYGESQVNLAVGRLGGGSGRQPGSSFKPLVLAEAIDQGISPRSQFFAPITMTFPEANDGEDWEVSGGSSPDGIFNLVEATRSSSNTVYAQLMLRVGPANVVTTANRMGVTASLPAVPALVLGSGEVSVLDMASAYSTLANRGEAIEPRAIVRIEDATGVEIWRAPVRSERVFEQDVADAVTHSLRGVIDRGTGRLAAFGRDAAGKTGTTQDNRDAWFVGYTCDLTASVWMGHVGAPGEPPRFLTDVQGYDEVSGGTLPAQMWGDFLGRVTDADDGCRLPSIADPGGTVLNDGLVTTTTTSTSEVPPAEPATGEVAPDDSLSGDSLSDDSPSAVTTTVASTSPTTTAAPATTSPTTSVAPATTVAPTTVVTSAAAAPSDADGG